MSILRFDNGLLSITVIVIAVLFTWIRAQPQESQTKSKNGKQSVTADQKSNDAAGVDVLPPKNADEIAKYHREREEENLFYDKLIAYGTIALAAFTFCLFIYTARLWRATVHLGEEAKRTSDRQANEMANSIAIAKDAAEAAVVASMPVLSPLVIGGTLIP